MSRKLLVLAEPSAWADAVLASRRNFEVVRVGGYQRGIDQLQSSEVTAILLDVGSLRSDKLDALLRSVADRGIPLVACALPLSSCVTRLLDVIRHVPAGAVIWHPESARQLANQVLYLPRVVMSSLLLAHYASRLLRIPDSLRTLLAIEICAPNGVDLRDVAMRSLHQSTRSLRRSLFHASLPRPNTLRQCSRVALAWELLADETLPLRAVAAQAGFGSERALHAAFYRTFGAPPRRAKQLISAEGALRGIVAFAASSDDKR